MRRRIDMLQDCLAILSEGDYDDAMAVIKALYAMQDSHLLNLAALFRPVDCCVTTRNELAIAALKDET